MHDRRCSLNRDWIHSIGFRSIDPVCYLCGSMIELKDFAQVHQGVAEVGIS